MKPTIQGHRVRHARERAALSQNQLSSKIGISQAGICRIENGQSDASLRVAVSIARNLSVSLDWLTGIKNGTLS